MTVKEAMEKTENLFQAMKLLEYNKMIEVVKDQQIEKQTGKIYDIHNLGFYHVALKTEKGIYRLSTTGGLEQEDQTYEEVIKQWSLFISVNNFIRQQHKNIRNLIGDKPVRVYINPYSKHLHIIHSNGKVVMINFQMGFKRTQGLIDNKIICSFEELLHNNKVYYRLIGDNKDILEIMEDAYIDYHSIYFLPKKEFMDKLYKVYKDYNINQIPEETAKVLYESGFVPCAFGMKKGEITANKTSLFISFSSMNKIRKVKVDQPDFIQKLKKALIEISIK
jgi:hypothetical protein